MNNKPLQDIVADYSVTSEACRLGILDDKSALVWSIVGKKYGEEGMYDVFDVLPREFGEQTNIQSPALTLEEIAKIIPGKLEVDFSRQIVRIDAYLPKTVVEKAPERTPATGRTPKNTEAHIIKESYGLFYAQCVWGPYLDWQNAASAAMFCMIAIENKKRAIAQKEEV